MEIMYNFAADNYKDTTKRNQTNKNNIRHHANHKRQTIRRRTPTVRFSRPAYRQRAHH